MPSDTAIVAIVAAIPALISALVAARGSRTQIAKVRSDIAHQQQERDVAAQELVHSIQEDAAQHMDWQSRQIEGLRVQIDALSAQVAAGQRARSRDHADITAYLRRDANWHSLVRDQYEELLDAMVTGGIILPPNLALGLPESPDAPDLDRAG